MNFLERLPAFRRAAPRPPEPHDAADMTRREFLDCFRQIAKGVCREPTWDDLTASGDTVTDVIDALYDLSRD